MADGGGASRARVQLWRVAAQGDGKRETVLLSPHLSPSDLYWSWAKSQSNRASPVQNQNGPIGLQARNGSSDWPIFLARLARSGRSGASHEPIICLLDVHTSRLKIKKKRCSYIRKMSWDI